MRFLIGILTGTIVTLLVATAMDAPTHPLLNNAKDLAAAGWDRLINATSTSLFEPADAEEAAPTDLRGQVQSEESLESGEDTEPFAPPLRRDTTTDDTRLPRTLDDPLDEQAAYAALDLDAGLDPAATLEEGMALETAAAFKPAAALEAPAPVAEPPASEFWTVSALAAEVAENANQPVWVPFHSQMSAEGFANRLSRSLDHEFRVVRQGAGAYQVVFDATDADQRAFILAQVTEITGQ